MCTAITYKPKDSYFGRNLDLEHSYQETVTITPRNYELVFREVGVLEKHHAMIGIAYVVEDYPLYYDAVNEKGLAMAGLNFPGNACYNDIVQGMDNITPFEFIPWILGQCETVAEVRGLLNHINLINVSFSDELPVSPLHWMIADKEYAIVVEPVKDGLKVHDNPVGVLTNNPVFEYHLQNLSNYLHLSAKQPDKYFGSQIELHQCSRGVGAVGLPGDWSSASRFVRAAFVKMYSFPKHRAHTDKKQELVFEGSEQDCVNQFFHILGSVAHPKGCVEVELEKYQYTIYSCCCNQDKGIYYYTTYENREVTGIDMYQEDLSGVKLICYNLRSCGTIYIQNKQQIQDIS